MNENKSLYEVNRKEYLAFLEQIKPECKRYETIEVNQWTTVTKTFSLKTNKCLCSRVFYDEKTENQPHLPEKYYIFEMPDDDERQKPIPKMQLELKTLEEVQAFFQALNNIIKENKDD